MTYATPSLNPASLIRFSLTHIQMASFPSDSLQFLLDNLMTTDQFLPFVIALLGDFLGTEVEGSVKGKVGGKSSRPAPSAKPRSRRSLESTTFEAITHPPASPSNSVLGASSSSGNSSPYPLPTLHTFLLHLSSSISVPTWTKTPLVDIVDINKAIVAKTCILVAFDRTHTSPALSVGSGAREKADEWRKALQQGTVLNSLTSCFERHMPKLKSTGAQIPALIGALYDLVGDMADIASANAPDIELSAA